MPRLAKQASSPKPHSVKPPCFCDSCLRSTAEADQKRAEIAAILERLEAVERLAVQS